ALRQGREGRDLDAACPRVAPDLEAAFGRQPRPDDVVGFRQVDGLHVVAGAGRQRAGFALRAARVPPQQSAPARGVVDEPGAPLVVAAPHGADAGELVVGLAAQEDRLRRLRADDLPPDDRAERIAAVVLAFALWVLRERVDGEARRLVQGVAGLTEQHR